jgi:hypothetical protein
MGFASMVQTISASSPGLTTVWLVMSEILKKIFK